MDGVSKVRLEGFLNVSKPHGWTSHDVVQVVRRLTGTRRVGHAGTLDPAATGVLVVAVGRATRLVDYLACHDKSYRGDVVLGVATDTDDAEGRVLYARDASSVSLDQLREVLDAFIGEIEQVPPQFSAIKLQGRKAYEIARKGETAKLAPRRVTINGISVLAWEPPKVSLLIHCSKGTYIRSLARDLGERLGVGGHLSGLVRLSSGPFKCEDAVEIEELKLAAEAGDLHRFLHPIDVAVGHLPAAVAAGGDERAMKAGRRWPATVSESGSQLVRVYGENGGFLGLAEMADDCWQPKLVLTEEQ